jgi:hypothetical protein
MREAYDRRLNARLTLDSEDRVRGISHVGQPLPSEGRTPRDGAISYLRSVAEALDIPAEQLEYAHQPASFLEPAERGTEYRLWDEKMLLDSTTEVFCQTHLNVPVWGAGLTVTMKANPPRIVNSVNTSLEDLAAKLPPDGVVTRWRGLFEESEPDAERWTAEGMQAPDRSSSGSFVADLLRGSAFKRSTSKAAVAARDRARTARVLRGRFFVYRYLPDERLPNLGAEPADTFAADEGESPLVAGVEPTLPLPAVDKRIRPEGDYLVAEIVFFYPTPAWGDINWRALVELETGSVLYLRSLAAHVDTNCLVFRNDPISKSGTGTNGPASTSAVLNGFRDDEPLLNLNPPVSGVQSLRGSRVAISEKESPLVAAPTEASGTDFDFDARTNDFAAVNAYYHANRFFDLVEDLGFPLSIYFGGTTFPVPVDHRGLASVNCPSGNCINAHCNGTGSGIDHLCYALADTTDTTNPIGIATDWRVHLHELGGHGILHDHVGGPNFGFSHSAGDSMALILSDPESQAPDRFLLAPFVPAVPRRCDRGVAEWSVANVSLTSGGSGYTGVPAVTLSGGGGSGATAFVSSMSAGMVTGVLVGNPGTGYTSAPTVTFSGGGSTAAAAGTATIGTWAWGGGMDLGLAYAGYRSEEILATTLFRAYRSIGGDSDWADRRLFASRYMAYLILRTVSTLTPMTNPANPLAFATSMIAADLLNWTSEGVDGGAYGKVIRWAFEKQGLYQPGSPAPGSVTTEGDPPAVDVYIDDGRGGEYQFQPNHWSTTTIWNRLAPDGGSAHQPPVLGASNYVYVKIKNRGAQQAQDVIVRGYHCLPGAGLLWPNDFAGMTTPEIAVGTLGPNDSEEKTVGPFEWTPNVNGYGHDCLLMIVWATGDPSNVDNFGFVLDRSSGPIPLVRHEVVPEWRLVPNDNNVGQRNVTLVPGGGGSGGLTGGLAGASFWAGNPHPAEARMEVSVELPEMLAGRGWRVGFRGLRGDRFRLGPGEKRELVLEVTPGATFGADDVVGEQDVVVTLRADGAPIGGMTYRIDPTLDRPANVLGGPKEGDDRCLDQARRLLDCLDLPARDVKAVRVKKITIEISTDDCD